MEIYKYPRTRHIEGSRLQIGDIADDKPIKELADKYLVIEEKLDGANSAVSFSTSGEILLQSRGHYLSGGGRERHFALFKTWAATHAQVLYPVLKDRYIMYGEWLYAKHTVFYDQLPHYFMEFDVLDRQTGLYLSTDARSDLLRGLPIMPVPVLYQGIVTSLKQIESFIRPSLYKSSDWKTVLEQAAVDSGSRLEIVEQQTEDSELAEGLYFKQERGRAVEDRFKYVRGDFVQAIAASDGHWHDRPILPNQLADGVDIFAPRLGIEGAYDE